MHPRVFASELWLPGTIEEVFGFFGDARNLQAITPDWLDFRIVTPDPIVMRIGTLIDYRLRLHGFPLRWRSEITAWEPLHRFVDEQRRGPYRLWIHEHRFNSSGNGTTVSDLVKYLPRGGWLIDRLLVRRDLARIFTFRRQTLLRHFETTGRGTQPG